MDQNKSISEQREYKVVKSNELIQKSRFVLSTQEQKIILYLISKIKPSDTDFQVYNFHISEFCQICGLDTASGKNYTNIRESIKKLADKSFWILFENGESSLIRWINKAWMIEQSGHIKIRLDDEMKPYLLELKKNFTQYGLIYILAMKSQYSIRFYETLKSFENLHIQIFDINKLKNILSCEHYDRFPDFKRYVLDIVVKEINTLTDILIEYRPIKEGRKITQIEFKIKTKTETTERLKAFAEIEKILRNDGYGH